MSDAKRVLIWDVDDVLNDCMRTWFDEWWRPQHAECTQAYEDLTANPPDTVLGISEVAYLASLDSFRQARFSSLVPCPEVLQWFSEHGHRGHHVALTAMPHSFAHLSAEWVVRHFGRWIRTVAFVPAGREGTRTDGQWNLKVDYLEWLGRGDVFIDDREDNVGHARALGLRGVVVPQPWNTAADGSLRATLLEVAQCL